MVGEFEHALDDRELCAGRVQSTEGTPVVHHHTGSDDITASVHSTSLYNSTLIHVSTSCQGSDLATLYVMEIQAESLP